MTRNVSTKQPQRVLIMASGTPHSSLTHRVVALGNELARHGYIVTMIAPRRDRHSHWLDDMPATMGAIRMIYPRQLAGRNMIVNLVPYIIGAMWHVLTQRADVVYLYKPTPLSIPGLLATWFKGVPVVLDMDDLGSEVMKIEQQPAVMYNLVAACERLAARSARGIVVVSRLLMKEFSNGRRDQPMLILSNGVDPNRFKPQVSAAGRTPRIIFFGMLGSTRIISPLLQALPAVIGELGSEAVTVEILGEGSARKTLEAQSKALGLQSNVHFRGWVDLDNVASYVAAGDVAWCVTPDERTMAAASNQKVFQYQALGLATVVSNVGDLPVYADDGTAAMVVENIDPMTLSKALIQLLSDSKLRQELSINGRQRVERESSWQVLGARLVKFLQEITT